MSLSILRSGRVRLAALAAVVATSVSGCGFSGLYGTSLPGGADLGDHPYSLTIYFDNVLDLVPQSAVKVNDVPVGRVETVALTSKSDNSGDRTTNGWTAKVTVKVNGDVKLPTNARAEIRQTSLLGEKYVDLEQPTQQPAGTDLKSGDTITLANTGSAPETEEVLGALSLLLNGGGLQQIKVITTELNKALHGNEGAVRDLLTQLNTFVGTLDSQKDQIVQVLVKVNRLAVTLDNNKTKIEAALDNFPRALQILKNNRAKLTQMLVSLSNLGVVATRVINETQTNFVSSLKLLSAPVEQLAASGSNLVESLKIAGTFPFPLKTTLTAIRGDYANLNLFIDLNLSNQLCGLNKQLCTIAKSLPLTQSASTHAVSGSGTPISGTTGASGTSGTTGTNGTAATGTSGQTDPMSRPTLIGVSG